jgi:hypothetical protein
VVQKSPNSDARFVWNQGANVGSGLLVTSGSGATSGSGHFKHVLAAAVANHEYHRRMRIQRLAEHEDAQYHSHEILRSCAQRRWEVSSARSDSGKALIGNHLRPQLSPSSHPRTCKLEVGPDSRLTSPLCRKWVQRRGPGVPGCKWDPSAGQRDSQCRASVCDRKRKKSWRDGGDLLHLTCSVSCFALQNAGEPEARSCRSTSRDGQKWGGHQVSHGVHEDLCPLAKLPSLLGDVVGISPISSNL